jgi:hypothetical protein
LLRERRGLRHGAHVEVANIDLVKQVIQQRLVATVVQLGGDCAEVFVVVGALR